MSVWSHLTKLSQLPHRASASIAEAKAARLIADELEKLGFVVEHQYFRAPRKTLYYGPSVTIIIYLFAAFWLGTTHPYLALLLMVLSLIPLVGELLGWPINLDALLPKFRSQNLVAQLPPSGALPPAPGDAPAQEATASAPGDKAITPESKPHVIVTAHFDTQFSSWLFAPVLRSFVQPFFTSVYVVLVLLPLVLALNALWPALPLVGEVMWLGSVYLAIVAIGLVIGSISGGYINGANDNGSGTALTLALAQKAASGAFADLETTFVFTGSEETGTRGMMHFVSGFDANLPDQTYFVNLDNLGAGIPRYLEGEGMLGFEPYHPGLISLAQQVSELNAGRVIAKHNLLLPTDGVIAARAGYPAITFIAMDEKGNIPHYHWFSDTIENIDRSLLEYMESYLTQYLQTLPVQMKKGREASVAVEAVEVEPTPTS